MAIGWQGMRTQRGVVIAGSFSTRLRIISKEVEPLPMTIDARNSTTSTPVEASTRPTS